MTRRQRLSDAPGQGPTSQGGPESGIALSESQGRFLASQRKRGNRGIYRCGCCGKRGHTRKTCPRWKPWGKSRKWGSTNADYRDNRKERLCDDCGTPSAKARCGACCKRRKRWPSRQTAYRKERGTW